MIISCEFSFARPKPRGPLTAPVPPDVSVPTVLPTVSGRTSGFKFSKRSSSKMVGVDKRLRDVAKLALAKSQRDFAITEGVRTLARQKELVSKGRSQTLASKHLYGDAIDVMAYYGGKGSWDMSHYFLIANAFVYAAKELDIGVRWGGAWHVPDIRKCAAKTDPGKTMQELYRQTRKRQGRKVFIDAVHFELTDA